MEKFKVVISEPWLIPHKELLMMMHNYPGKLELQARSSRNRSWKGIGDLSSFRETTFIQVQDVEIGWVVASYTEDENGNIGTVFRHVHLEPVLSDDDGKDELKRSVSKAVEAFAKYAEPAQSETDTSTKGRNKVRVEVYENGEFALDFELCQSSLMKLKSYRPHGFNSNIDVFVHVYTYVDSDESLQCMVRSVEQTLSRYSKFLKVHYPKLAGYE
jgi:hypothetical protein